MVALLPPLATAYLTRPMRRGGSHVSADVLHLAKTIALGIDLDWLDLGDEARGELLDEARGMLERLGRGGGDA